MMRMCRQNNRTQNVYEIAWANENTDLKCEKWDLRKFWDMLMHWKHLTNKNHNQPNQNRPPFALGLFKSQNILHNTINQESFMFCQILSFGVVCSFFLKLFYYVIYAFLCSNWHSYSSTSHTARWGVKNNVAVLTIIPKKETIGLAVSSLASLLC